MTKQNKHICPKLIEELQDLVEELNFSCRANVPIIKNKKVTSHAVDKDRIKLITCHINTVLDKILKK